MCVGKEIPKVETFFFLKDLSMAENWILSERIQGRMNSVMKRLEVIMEGHPKLRKDMFKRFRKVK